MSLSLLSPSARGSISATGGGGGTFHPNSSLSTTATTTTRINENNNNNKNNNNSYYYYRHLNNLRDNDNDNDNILYYENTNTAITTSSNNYEYLYVLPVLLMEFLALALTRAVLPQLLIEAYGHNVYIVLGCADFVRGLLAFWTCPIFGKISDIIGRRICLFITVLGTCIPVCSLAIIFNWENNNNLDDYNNNGLLLSELESSSEVTSPTMEGDGNGDQQSDLMGMMMTTTTATTTSIGTTTPSHPVAITVFVVLLALSGIFSSTFTLTFAYISDTIKNNKNDRVSAYGLALATFGLSFTLGPIIGGYLAQSNKQYVFLTSLVLTVLDLLYIYAVLPESRKNLHGHNQQQQADRNFHHPDDDIYGINNNDDDDDDDTGSVQTNFSFIAKDQGFSWNPLDTIRIVVLVDPFLRQVGKVAFLYYTGLWALISTLSLYAVQRFHLSPERLGELISVLGLSTMVAEAVLVRILVPLLGEKRSMQLGLLSFALQCVVLGFAYEGWHLFVCAAFSLLGNLVYPSLTSLVSGNVEGKCVGEALGAINGIKALTEGIGPLLFGSLMTISEHSALPGWPYLLAAGLVVAAYKEAAALPDPDRDEYIHELERKHEQHRHRHRRGPQNHQQSENGGILMRTFAASSRLRHPNIDDDDEDEELENLISEVDESWDDSDHNNNNNNNTDQDDGDDEEDLSQLPRTFAAFAPKKVLPSGP